MAAAHRTAAGRAQPAQWVRTCVGCRQRTPASELLRVVAVLDRTGPGTGQARLVPDPARRLFGRGAHLHPDPECLALALRRRAFVRALRLSGVPDAGDLVELLDPDRKSAVGECRDATPAQGRQRRY